MQTRKNANIAGKVTTHPPILDPTHGRCQLQNNGRNTAKSFLCGKKHLDGYTGYWATNEEGEAGFLEENSDCFWTFMEEDESRVVSDFAGRQTYNISSFDGMGSWEAFRSKGKGKGKGRGEPGGTQV